MSTLWPFIVLSICFAYAAWSGNSSEWGAYWSFFIAGGVVFGISNSEDREAEERDQAYGPAYAARRAIEQERRAEEWRRTKAQIIAEYLEEEREELEADFVEEMGCSSDEYLRRIKSKPAKPS